MPFNVESYAERLYRFGHRPEDFAELADGLIVVSPIRPPQVVSGLHVPGQAKDIPGQFALTHKVEAVAADVPSGPLFLCVGDIIKCTEAHLDPLEPGCNLLSIHAKHVKAVVARAHERVGAEPVKDAAE